MEKTFKKSSLHYRYFHWITGMGPLKSLCPYFWINVAITVLLPIILLAKLIMFINKKISFKKEKKPNFKRIEHKYGNHFKTDRFFMKLGDLFGYFLIFVMAPLTFLYLFYSIGLMIFVIPFDTLWTGILIMASVFVGWIIIYNFLKEISGVFKYLNPFNWTITKVLWEMIKAIYYKACPIIKWED